MNNNSLCNLTRVPVKKHPKLNGLMMIAGITFASVTIATQANAIQLNPVSYDMPNGEDGTYTYFDDSYSGSGDKTTMLAPLTGGLGDLTDGIIATSSLNVTPSLYVGWYSIDPIIQFHFANQVNVNSLTIYFDEEGEESDVNTPNNVTIAMGGDLYDSGVLATGSGPSAYTFSGLNLTGNSLDLTLNRRTGMPAGHSYVMLSEVTFDAVAVPWETDALPVVGTTLIFGLGVWSKRRNTQKHLK